MQKKTKKQTTGKGSGKPAKRTKLTPQERALTKEQLVESLCRPIEKILLERAERGKSLEDMLLEFALKGITSEQLGRWIERERILGELFTTDKTLQAIAFDLQIELSDVLEVVNYLETTVDPLIEQGKNSEEIAEIVSQKWASLSPQDIEGYIDCKQERAENAKALAYYARYYNSKEAAEETGLDEDTISDIFYTFKNRVLNYSARGVAIEEQANLLGVAASQIVDAIVSNKTEIKELRAVTLQTMLVDSKENTRSRVSRLTALRDTIAAEIKSRGLAEISADKLVTLYLKVEESLRAEVRGLEADFSNKSANSLAFSLSE